MAKEIETNFSKEDVAAKGFGSNNIVIPLKARIYERLSELEKDGKVHFYKDENKEFQTIEPKFHVVEQVSFMSLVKKISEDEYRITYSLFDVDNNNKVKTVNIRQGIGDPGQERKIIAYRITETFKKGYPFITEKKKVDDYDAIKNEQDEREKEFKLRA